MNRREFVRTMGVGAAALIGSRVMSDPEPERHGRRPPNVLFILTDQQRFDALGANGNEYMHTPNLDKLCGQSVNFTNAYVAQAVCSPSRASIFSGLYPHAHRVQDNIYGISDVTSMPEYNMGVTWPLLLQQGGYHTGYVGKWHLGEEAPKWFGEWYGFNSLLPHWMGKKYESQYRCDWETDVGLDFIRRNRSRPFVLCQSYYPPHTPYEAPKEYHKYYEGTPLVEGRPLEYYAACSNIDYNVGRLVKGLEDLDLLDDTLIIYTSDHGETFGTRPGGANKRSAYDVSAKVPLIMRLPGVFEGGREQAELVSNVDIMPTILRTLEVKTPKGLHGRSLTPVVTGRASDWRTAVCIENREDLGKGDDSDGRVDSRGVRTEGNKLILRDKLSIRAKSLRELYDMAGDPGETNDIYGPAQRESVVPILDWLDEWSASTEDGVGRRLARDCRKDIAGE